jgi:L-threonylcarbamoyladenylate synthase
VQTPVTTNTSRAVEILRNGGVVAVPTETVYGLAALALDQSAVERVYAAKGRPHDHPLIVHLAPSADPTAWGHFDDNALMLAAAFWPGPLTLLVPRTELVPDWVTGGRESVALRVPAHPVTIDILEALADGVVAPSANRFGHVSPTTAAHVVADLGGSIDLIVDGGPCSVGVESTIVECSSTGLQILRPGAITSADVERATGTTVGALTGGARAPGMLASHYAPRAAVELLDTPENAHARVAEVESRGMTARVIWHPDSADYARLLYSELREADDAGAEIVCAVVPDTHGLGSAVRDRLERAAAR